MTASIKPAMQLIAPCGMNCGLCLAFLRDKNKCGGCRGTDNNKPNHCRVCRIKFCGYLFMSESDFCYDCIKFPCVRLRHLDKRYKTKYRMSMIDTLGMIKNSGLEKFVWSEKIRWKCHNCGGTICVHRGFCLECNKKNGVHKKN
jgi:hypothetical protein